MMMIDCLIDSTRQMTTFVGRLSAIGGGDSTDGVLLLVSFGGGDVTGGTAASAGFSAAFFCFFFKGV